MIKTRYETIKCGKEEYVVKKNSFDKNEENIYTMKISFLFIVVGGMLYLI